MFVERKSNKSAVLPGAQCPSPIIANFSRKIAQLGNFANYEQILCLLKSFLKKTVHHPSRDEEFILFADFERQIPKFVCIVRPSKKKMEILPL